MGLEVLVRVSLGLWVLRAASAGGCSEKTGCDDCIQTRGCDWCSAPTQMTSRCREASQPADFDDWCPKNLISPKDVEIITLTNDSTSKDIHYVDSRTRVAPRNLQVKARLGIVQVEFQYRSKTKKDISHQITKGAKYIKYQKPEIQTKEVNKIDVHSLYNVTLSFDVHTCPDPDSEESNIIEILAGPTSLFTSNERLNIMLEIVCNCNCSESVEPESASIKCTENGKWRCGACTCRNGWSGPTCEQRKSQLQPESECDNRGRGDQNIVDMCQPGKFGDEKCSGRGSCVCGRCQCNETNYFDEFCTDFCLATEECALCLYQHNSTKSEDRCSKVCQNTVLGITVDESGGTAVPLSPCFVRDSEGCQLKYEGKMSGMTAELQLHDKNCTAAVFTGAIGSGAGVFVGGIVGALVVAGLATGGFLLWKALHPPQDFATSGGYDNMDAEAHQGENPLYRPPNSSFRNPLYQQGKKL